MITILGAGGVISNELVKLLAVRKLTFPACEPARDSHAGCELRP